MSLAVSSRVLLHRPRRSAARHWPPRAAPAPAAAGSRCAPRGAQEPSPAPPRPRPARLRPLRAFPFFALTSFPCSPLPKPRPKQANKSTRAGRALLGGSSIPGKRAVGDPARGRPGAGGGRGAEPCEV